jgi:hypothetical protein
MDFLQYNNQADKTKSDKFFECVKIAAKAVHCINNINWKRNEIEKAIALNNKQCMWNVLQENLKKYRAFINSFGILTNLEVRDVPAEFYNICTVEDLKDQLEQIINFIYVHELLTCAARETFIPCLKKTLKKTKLFTDKELAFLTNHLI